MKKNLTALILSAFMMTTSVPVVASALYIPPTTPDAMKERLDGYTYIQSFEDCKENQNFHGSIQDYYKLNEDGTEFLVKQVTKERFGYIRVKPSQNVTGDLKLIDRAIVCNIEASYVTDENDYLQMKVTKATPDAVKKLYFELEKEGLVDEMEYCPELYSEQIGYAPLDSIESFSLAFDVRTREYRTESEQQKLYDNIVKFVEDNKIDSTVTLDISKYEDKVYYTAKIKPNGNAELSEKIMTVNMLNDEFGIGASGGVLLSTTPTRIDSEYINLTNFVDGDANNNGGLDLGDAILIMQSIGNPEKYKLSAQSQFNADIAGDFDGITNLDALTVQRKLLKLE